MMIGMCQAVVGRSVTTAIAADDAEEAPVANAGAVLADSLGGTDAGGNSLESDMECSKNPGLTWADGMARCGV